MNLRGQHSDLQAPQPEPPLLLAPGTQTRESTRAAGGGGQAAAGARAEVLGPCGGAGLLTARLRPGARAEPHGASSGTPG